MKQRIMLAIAIDIELPKGPDDQQVIAEQYITILEQVAFLAGHNYGVIVLTPEGDDAFPPGSFDIDKISQGFDNL